MNRSRLVVWLMTLLMCAAPAAAELDAKELRKQFPEKSRLRKPKAKSLVARSMRYELPRDVTAAKAPAARVATLGKGRRKKDILFFDVDGNGRFDDAGIDAWIVDSGVYKYVIPIDEAIVLDRDRFFLHFDSESKWVHYRREPPALPEIEIGPTPEEQLEARQSAKEIVTSLLIWNRFRLRNGLVPVHLDPDLTYGAMMHVRYMDQHGVSHDEDPEKAGYTEQGARVGKNGSVGPGPVSKEIVACYQSFYHRIMLFHPDTRGVGIGDGVKRSVLDGVSSRLDRKRARPWKWPVIVPADAADRIPLSFSYEKPIPHPTVFTTREELQGAGFPITLTFERPNVKAVTAELRLNGPDGELVETLVSWPKERPANPSQPDNFKSICVIPRRTLRPHQVYWVKVAYTLKREQREHIWRFATHSR